MTTQTSLSASPVEYPVRESAYLSRARDGDVLVMLEGAGLKPDTRVDVVLQGQRLRIVQGGRVAADLELDGMGCEAIVRAPHLVVQEIYLGSTEDEHTFVFHEDAILIDRTGE